MKKLILLLSTIILMACPSARSEYFPVFRYVSDDAQEIHVICRGKFYLLAFGEARKKTSASDTWLAAVWDEKKERGPWLRGLGTWSAGWHAPRYYFEGTFDEKAKVLRIADDFIVYPATGEGAESGELEYLLEPPLQIAAKTAKERDHLLAHSRRMVPYEACHVLWKDGPNHLSYSLSATRSIDLALGGLHVDGYNLWERFVFHRMTKDGKELPHLFIRFSDEPRNYKPVENFSVKKSHLLRLAAFQCLRRDLYLSNTGRQEAKLVFRGTGESDGYALLDWYFVAPFYDPQTKTYRDTLERSDFTTDPKQQFDPQDKNFDPKWFVRKFVPWEDKK